MSKKIKYVVTKGSKQTTLEAEDYANAKSIVAKRWGCKSTDLSARKWSYQDVKFK